MALTIETLNPNLLQAEYAVRGRLPQRAEILNQALKRGEKLPFNEVLFCNIGNPLAFKTQEITFYRNVMVLCDKPDLLERNLKPLGFHEEEIERAKEYIRMIPGGSGAYPNSAGIQAFREHVANFIEKRDGFSSNPNHIYLTNGASDAIELSYQMLFAQPTDAIFVPIPQYPLYSALASLFGAQFIGYELNEEEGWSIHLEDLEFKMKEARKKGLTPKALVVINPGNPTGQCMKEPVLKGVATWCAKADLVLLADEVYQDNVYTKDSQFISLKKIRETCSYLKNKLQLISFHSTSRGLISECGRRGGYLEAVGFSDAIFEQITKVRSIGLCSNINGQIMLSLMCNPPSIESECGTEFLRQRQSVFQQLQRKSQMLVTFLNTLPGVSSQAAQGSMYVFPKLELPKKLIRDAHSQNIAPDELYCLKLLEATGICTVPGSGFGQKRETFHLRMTFLPTEEKLKEALQRFKTFHTKLLES